MCCIKDLKNNIHSWRNIWWLFKLYYQKRIVDAIYWFVEMLKDLIIFYYYNKVFIGILLYITSEACTLWSWFRHIMKTVWVLSELINRLQIFFLWALLHNWTKSLINFMSVLRTLMPYAVNVNILLMSTIKKLFIFLGRWSQYSSLYILS